MKFACLQENLARGLATVNRAVAQRGTLPITQNILLQAEGQKLVLTGTDLSLTIRTEIPAMVEQEGAITLPARMTTEFVSSIAPDRVDVEMDEKACVVNFSCGRAKASINGINALDFPPTPEIKDGIPASCSPEQMRDAISRVANAAAKEESRPILTGVMMKTDSESFTMAAADGFQLAVYHGELAESPAEDFNVVIPATAALELHRLIGNQEQDIQFMMVPAKQQAMFKTAGAVMVTQLLNGNFPDYSQLVPTEKVARVVIGNTALTRAVRTAAIFAKDGSNIVRFHTAPTPGQEEQGLLQISSSAEEVGNNKAVLSVLEYEGNKAKVAINFKYVNDFLASTSEDKIEFNLGDPSYAVLMKIPEKDNYLRVAMPMFVSWDNDSGPLQENAPVEALVNMAPAAQTPNAEAPADRAGSADQDEEGVFPEDADNAGEETAAENG